MGAGAVWYSGCMGLKSSNEKSFHDMEVSFGLTTLLRVKGVVDAVGSVAVISVLDARRWTYHILPTARVKISLGESLSRLLARPFASDQRAWVLNGTEVRTVLTAGGF
jgi:hypothetical protein